MGYIVLHFFEIFPNMPCDFGLLVQSSDLGLAWKVGKN